MSTISNETLKEYYVKLMGLQENCINILQAINQSLTSNASEVTVDIVTETGDSSTLRIPSFLYLDSKVEQLSANFDALHDMPKSGEAWFTKSSDMWKLKMVRASTAPVTPEISSDKAYAGFSQSVLLKDLVSPHTHLRLKIDNLPGNAEHIMMRKLIINSQSLYNSLINMNLKTYDEYKSALYNYIKGIEYDEYDAKISLPVRHDSYASEFRIVSIPDSDLQLNPWYEEGVLYYKVQLSTLNYTDTEDSLVKLTLKIGDRICLGNELAIYTVISVDKSSDTVIIREDMGHQALSTYNENNAMVFQLYNDSYKEFDYVDVPLEENQYIVLFLGIMADNVRSQFSQGYPVDLSSVYMKNEDGSLMKDEKGNLVTYMDYYNKYCVNIGDLILGITETSYPQLTEYTGDVLNNIISDSSIQTLVSATIDNENILKVVPINKHLTNDQTTEEIISLHAQKNDIQANLATVQDNISQIYNTLTNTDFSQETANSMASLQSKLTGYYTERTTLQKQLNAIIDNINAKSLDVTVVGSKVKYRIRGTAVTKDLEDYLANLAPHPIDIIGMDIEYKYVSTTKDTDTITVINSSTFTDWNKQSTIERERELEFDSNLATWRLKFKNYASTDNIIKWNQIDIPIRDGEDVIVRIRYKYAVGQPFVNLYTPWSDELTIVFPPEFRDSQELESILQTNEKDTLVAGFRKILIDEGFDEHINNKLVSQESIFFHQPENIYSGFNTPENVLISLKDKLLMMSQDIEQYKNWVEGEMNSKFEVYLQYDEQMVPISQNNINHINIYNTEHVAGTFIRKDINIIIKNTGTSRLNLYSIFPGNTDIALLKADIESYKEQIVNYERVPLIVNNQISHQYLGQWIYFRQTNPYTMEDIYYNLADQRESDVDAALSGEDHPDIKWISASCQDYLMKDNAQCLLVYRDRLGMTSRTTSMFKKFGSTLDSMVEYTDAVRMQGTIGYESRDYVDYEEMLDRLKRKIKENITFLDDYETVLHKAYLAWDDEDYVYVNSVWSTKETGDGASNVYLLRYEDIMGENEATKKKVFLDPQTPIATFLDNYHPEGFVKTREFCGAFLFPNIISKQQLLTEGRSKDHIFIDSSEQLSIPIVFEYYLDGLKDEDMDHTKVKKSLFFDIKPSLIKNPIHYMLEFTGYFDTTAQGDMYNTFTGIDIEDNVTSAEN